MNSLASLKKMIEDLNQTNSSNDKIEVLKEYPDCKKLLRYTYDPFKQYNVTSTNIKKMKSKLQPDGIKRDVIELLDALDSRQITGHAAIAAVLQFIKDNSQYEELLYTIIDRNLKTRTDAKLINKVWPKTVPQFAVALANSYADRKDKVDFIKQIWYASRKLDGVRVIAIINSKNDIKFLSRQGKEFETLDNVKKAIQEKFAWHDFTPCVLDGEMCIVDASGNENFADVIKLIRRKDFTIPNPKYKIFDMMPLDEFEGTAVNTHVFHWRLQAIDNWKKWGRFDGKVLDPVEQRKITCEADLTEFVAEANSKKWEGLILREDVEYEGKRSNSMLKVKKFHDAEYKIEGAEMGPIRIIENGKEVERELLSAVLITHKGNTVRVGSGFSQDQRKQFHDHPEEIVGKWMTVQYFEETQNQKGEYSLRFPVVKVIYEGKRDL